MNVHEILVVEFKNLAVEDLLEAGTLVTPSAMHQTLTDWCDAYEDVPPRNRAERTVRDALIDARDEVGKLIHDLAATPY